MSAIASVAATPLEGGDRYPFTCRPLFRTIAFVPTAEDFRFGVADVVRELQKIASAQRTCDDRVDDFGFTGGISDLVHRSLVAGSSNAAQIGRLVGPFIDEMNRKARQCDQYTIDMQTYRSSHATWAAKNRAYQAAPISERPFLDPPGREPQQPGAPFFGAEASAASRHGGGSVPR